MLGRTPPGPLQRAQGRNTFCPVLPVTLTKDPAPGSSFSFTPRKDCFQTVQLPSEPQKWLESPSFSFSGVDQLMSVLPPDRWTLKSDGVLPMPERNFLGRQGLPLLCADSLGLLPSPSPNSPFRIPETTPRCLQVKRGGYKPSFKQPQESGCRFRLSRGAYQSRSLKTVQGIVQLSRFTTFLSPD